MARVFNDPDSMERFANDLGRFVEEIENALNFLKGSYATLGQDWQDRKKDEFEEKMIDLSNSITHFSEYANECMSYIMRQASTLRDYENM